MKNPWLAVTAVLLVVGLAPPAEAQRLRTGEERVEWQAAQEEHVLELYQMSRPIEAANSVWIGKMTWMEVRDAIAEGTATVIVPVGAVDQNGPYLVTNKHEVTLGLVCEGAARKLGNALCAPIVDFGLQGGIDPPSGQMRYSGVISVREETFAMLLGDIANSLRQHGFTDIFFITDKGTNEPNIRVIVKDLNERWEGVGATVYYLDEYYVFRRQRRDEVYLRDELGVEQPTNDGHHDNIVQTSLLMLADPANVRYEQRAKAGLLSINGVSIEDKEWVQEIAQKLSDHRIAVTVDAIRARLGDSNRD